MSALDDCLEDARKSLELYEKVKAKMNKKKEDLNITAQWFGEVMAVLHRDGGHYLSKHGPEKAAKDAIKNYYQLVTDLDRAQYLLLQVSNDKQIYTWTEVQEIIKKVRHE